MKLARCTDGNATFWARIDVDHGTATRLGDEFTKLAARLTDDPVDAPSATGEVHRLEDLRVLLPLEPTARVIALGATYAKHIAGLGLQMPEAPAGFLKPYSSLIGPGDEISYPAVTSQLDYEVELGVVVGAPASGDGQEPMASVFGYTVANDVSARDLQFSGSVTGMDMFSAKALDATSGVGPWIVTRDEFGGNGHPDLELRLEVDGQLRQHDRTSSMVWGVGELLAYVDERMALRPGDLVLTGTPAGVGHEDGRYLEPGQVVEATIEGIATLRNPVGARHRG